MSQERGRAQEDLEALLGSSVQRLAGAQGNYQQQQQSSQLDAELRMGVQGLQRQLAGSLPGSLLPQAVPNPMLSQDSQQQQWLHLATAMGAAAALSPATATLQPPPGLLPASSATAEAAAPQQGSEPMQEAHQPPQPEQGQQLRRRGRRPKPAELLTRKQLRTREQNRRYEERQRVSIHETEAALEATSAQLEQERAHHEQVLQTSMAYEHLVDYKGEMVDALRAAAELDPPHGISIPEEMVHLLAKTGVIEQLGSESIMRYAAGGYTAHLGPDGQVTKAPPFEAVARDWADIASKLRAVLEEARVPCPEQSEAEFTSQEGLATAALQGAHARESAPGEVQEVQEELIKSRMGPATVQTGSSAGMSGSGSGSAWAGFNSGASEGSSSGGPARICGCELGAQVEAAMQAEETERQKGISAMQQEQQLEHEQQQEKGGSAWPIPQAPCQPTVGGGPLPSGLGPSRLRAAARSAGDPAHNPVVSQQGKVPLALPELQGGMTVQDGQDLYRFTVTHLMQCGLLLRRIALVCWQQAALFPDNATKLVFMNLETCSGYEEQELPRWRKVVRKMRFSPEELETLVGLHKDYIAKLRPALVQRREALQRLRELHAAPTLTSQQDLMRLSLAASECNSALMGSAHTINAAAAAMSSGLWKMLQFPLGTLKMVLLSWPYYPQLHMIGLAAAEELGLDMDVYTSFNELFANLGQEGQED